MDINTKVAEYVASIRDNLENSCAFEVPHLEIGGFTVSFDIVDRNRMEELFLSNCVFTFDDDITTYSYDNRSKHFFIFNSSFSNDRIEYFLNGYKSLTIRRAIFLGEFDLMDEYTYDDGIPDPLYERGTQDIIIDDCIFIDPVNIDKGYSSINIFMSYFKSYTDLLGFDKIEIHNCTFSKLELEADRVDKLSIFMSDFKELEITPMHILGTLNDVSIAQSKIKKLRINDFKPEDEDDRISINNLTDSTSTINELFANTVTFKDVQLKGSTSKKISLVNCFVEYKCFFMTTECPYINLSMTNVMGNYHCSEVIYRTDISKLIEPSTSEEDEFKNLMYLRKLFQSSSDKNDLMRFEYYYHKRENSLRSFGWQKVLNYVIDYSTGYFTDYIKVLKSIFWVMLACAIFYFAFPYKLGLNYPPITEMNCEEFLGRLGNAVYFSIISFSTVGYGDISPEHFMKVIAGLEGIAGVLLASSFITTLVRRFT